MLGTLKVKNRSLIIIHRVAKYYSIFKYFSLAYCAEMCNKTKIYKTKVIDSYTL